MIPIKDYNKSKSFSFFNWMILIANIIVFIYQLKLSPAQLQEFIYRFAFIPQRFLDSPGQYWFTLFTSMFIHGGFLHLIGNMLFLYIFGDNVEDAFGHIRYLVFYLLGGVIASFVQMQFSQNLTVPNIGASGAISAALAAYLVLFPGAKVLTIVPIFVFITSIRMPAIILLGLWIVLQVFSGVTSIYSGQVNNVAYFAHIGGFVFGLIFALLGRKKYLKKYREQDLNFHEFHVNE